MKLTIEGEGTIDVEALIRGASFGSFYRGSNEQRWLSEILRTLSQSELRQFLRFVTGSTGVPATGTVYWEVISAGGSGRLPRAATCFRTLYLSNYSNRDEMRRKLLMAISEADGLED